MAQFSWPVPDWYKLALIIVLIVNPLVFTSIRLLPAGCWWWNLSLPSPWRSRYPLLPGGLLAIEAVMIGMTSPEHVREEIASNLEVLPAADVHGGGDLFMKQLLLFIFTRLLLGIRSKMLLSLSFVSQRPSSPPSSMR